MARTYTIGLEGYSDFCDDYICDKYTITAVSKALAEAEAIDKFCDEYELVAEDVDICYTVENEDCEVGQWYG